MRVYVELIDQRYDEYGRALGPIVGFSRLVERLDHARRNCAVETASNKSTSYETGTARMKYLPTSVTYLLTASKPSDLSELIALRDELEGKNYVMRVLKVEDLSQHVEAVAKTLSGDHGFERRGQHFSCVAGDECGLKVYQGDPGYDELVETAEKATKA